MMERRQIVGLWRREGSEAAESVLVTLVRVEGSSYRLPGAMLLVVARDGAHGVGHAGMLSGGCLEAEVIRRAMYLVREGAAVERYATTFDDTAEIPFGLGCGGVVDLLFEPVGRPEGKALIEALTASVEGLESKVVSFLPGGGRGLRRVIFGAEGEILFASPELNQHKLDCARGMEPGRAYEGRFVQRVEAPQRLFVLGAGDDAKPLVDLAVRMGWTVVVADGRMQQARADRFPGASRVLALAAGRGEQLGVTRRDAVILMTHSYEQDRELLAGMLGVGPRYLGVLGSRHRSSILVAETAGMLGRTVASCCEGLFAPVGMDLGGDGPESIALAIVAEVQAVVSGKIGGSRRLSAEEVGRQIERGGSSLYLQGQCALDSEG